MATDKGHEGCPKDFGDRAFVIPRVPFVVAFDFSRK